MATKKDGESLDLPETIENTKPAGAGSRAPKKEEIDSYAEPWLQDRFQELARITGTQSYELEEKRRRLREIRESIDAMEKEAISLESQIGQRARLRDRNQVALDFVRISLERIQGREEDGK